MWELHIFPYAEGCTNAMRISQLAWPRGVNRDKQFFMFSRLFYIHPNKIVLVIRILRPGDRKKLLMVDECIKEMMKKNV